MPSILRENPPQSRASTQSSTGNSYSTLMRGDTSTIIERKTKKIVKRQKLKRKMQE